jgi:hypothetical protein
VGTVSNQDYYPGWYNVNEANVGGKFYFSVIQENEAGWDKYVQWTYDLGKINKSKEGIRISPVGYCKTETSGEILMAYWSVMDPF